MAIKINNDYLKIVEIVRNVETKQDYVITKKYISENERNREKLLAPLFEQFRERAEKYIIDTRAKIDELIDQTITEDIVDEYLANNPLIKEKLDDWDSISEEYFTKVHNVLYEPIDINDLKHLELWNSLGLTEEMFEYIIFIRRNKAYTLNDNMQTLELDEAYQALKKLLPESEDC
jgi:hypothetical protein